MPVLRTVLQNDRMSDTKTSRWLAYELPLNERVRTFMRLEHLFAGAQRYAAGTDPWDNRAALTALLEILAILSRGDVRSDALREMERQAQALSRLRSRPGIDTARLDNIVQSLEKVGRRLDASGAQLGRSLKENEFLSAVKQRMSIPGGTCSFDLPSLQHWLGLPAEKRQEQLARWFGELDALDRGLRLILMLLRESAVPTQEVANGGMFHRTLDSGMATQLIRVLLPPDSGVFPEISGGRHRFTVRFLEQPDAGERPRQRQEDVPFQLAICQI